LLNFQIYKYEAEGKMKWVGCAAEIMDTDKSSGLTQRSYRMKDLKFGSV